MTEGIRLPTYTIPQNYVIHLTPFIIENNFTIEGHVDIEVDILKDANEITLHINGIEIYENMVEVQDETRYGLTRRLSKGQREPPIEVSISGTSIVGVEGLWVHNNF